MNTAEAPLRALIAALQRDIVALKGRVGDLEADFYEDEDEPLTGGHPTEDVDVLDTVAADDTVVSTEILHTENTPERTHPK